MQGRGKKRLVADINITPLVDVMLVLLIIFMVTAPMMTEGVNVDLPEVVAKSLDQSEKSVTISLEKDGKISINNITMTREIMLSRLEKEFKLNKKQTILLAADNSVPYGHVVQVMADVKAAGFEQLGMITQHPEKE